MKKIETKRGLSGGTEGSEDGGREEGREDESAMWQASVHTVISESE